MTPEALITYAQERLREQFGLSPVWGAEIECYVTLSALTPEVMDRFWRPVSQEAAEKGITLLRIEKERGHHQYELVFGMNEDAFALCDAIEHLRSFILARAEAEKVTADFHPRPFADAPPSGMHIHLNLKDPNGDSAFLKNDEYISPVLHHSLGGLCDISSHVMPVLCPYPEGFARYADADHIARTVSWGSNNRSCAIRIPYSPILDDKRLEWRLPCADARVDAVMAVMLMGVLAGIEHRLEPPIQNYGMASRDATLTPLPLTMDEAKVAMRNLPAHFAPLSAEMLEEWCALRLAA